jgi:methylated-DNA-[protein]-cysteine S-methyltransferase
MAVAAQASVEHDHAVVPAPFGALAFVLEGERLVSVRFLAATAAAAPRTAPGRRAAELLRRYLVDPRVRLDLPLQMRGTAFQCRVWRALVAIPSGRVRTYGDLAAELEAPARAVGQACGDNRLPLVIPCHRVVAASGLGGFGHQSAGFLLTVKRWLLEHEGALRGTLL